jgi:hypothetical protein
MCLPGMTAGALTPFQSASFSVLALPRSRSAKPGAVLSYGVLSAQTEKSSSSSLSEVSRDD